MSISFGQPAIAGRLFFKRFMFELTQHGAVWAFHCSFSSSKIAARSGCAPSKVVNSITSCCERRKRQLWVDNLDWVLEALGVCSQH